MTTTLRPICYECAHYLTIDTGCTAFPDGIPAAIINMQADHRRPHPGDGGIFFEPVEGSELTGDPEQPIPWLGYFQPKDGQTAEGGG